MEDVLSLHVTGEPIKGVLCRQQFDKVFLFSKNLHQNKYQELLQDFAKKIDPKVTSFAFVNIAGALR